MADSRPTADEGDERAEEADGESAAAGAPPSETAESTDQLRRQVEETYDFDDFGPADMAQMSAEEWEAAFDADSWIHRRRTARARRGRPQKPHRRPGRVRQTRRRR